MKINSPVDCQRFFQDEILQNREGVWCVTLSPTGQILSLFEAKMDGHENWIKTISLLCTQMKGVQQPQILVVRTHRASSLFNEEDWCFLEKLNRSLEAKEVALCDYVKICGREFSSLMEFDY